MVMRVMTKNVPVFPLSTTVGEVTRVLSDEKTDNFDSINYIYVADDKNRLRGVVSVKEILQSPEQSKVSQIMKTELVTVREHSPQEKAALLAIKNNIKAIPVVDKDNVFLGIIPSDVIMSILHRENVEDMLYSSGISTPESYLTNINTSTIKDQLRIRLPWLIIGLVGGIFAASIITSYDDLIQEFVLLAAFLPAVVYIGDAVGAQTQMIVIRSFAQDKPISFTQYLVKELRISSVLGVVLGGISGVISQLFWKSTSLSAVVAISFALTSIVASSIAVTLPFLFNKFNVDPAIGSGPIATVVRDMLSIIVYFTVAVNVLRFL